MTSNTTMKSFHKFLTNIINDYTEHLQSNGIDIPDEIRQSFLVEKPSKRKGKLSPYTVFMKEFRSNYQKQHPEMSFQEVSQAIAEKWAEIKENPEEFKQYEEKAKQYNSDAPLKHKKLCQAKKGSDGQSCGAEAKADSNFCGRHKKLAFDQVNTNDCIIESDSDSDYLSCQKANCTRHAESGPFCSFHSQETKPTCIKEKANGQLCGKPIKNNTEYCGFHNPTKTTKNSKDKKNRVVETQNINQEQESDIESNESSSIHEQEMFYDSDMNISSQPGSDGKLWTSFKIYNNDPIAYNNKGEEIGVIKENKINLF